MREDSSRPRRALAAAVKHSVTSEQEAIKGERKLTGSKQGGKKVSRKQARMKEREQEASKGERK